MLTPPPRFALPGLALALLAGTLPAAERLSYNRDVRPLLSDRCYKCHGPDSKTRKGELRLDDAGDALRSRKGGAVVVPGNPQESALIERIFTSEPDDQMPPPDSGLELSTTEKETLRQWVAEGGEFEPHWSFVAPQKAPLPTVSDLAWPRSPVDHFILARLAKEGLKPSREADRRTLLRRVTYDLTGIPPTLEEIVAFLADAAPDAYEKVVDRLLASPRFGERMAVDWLDVARYADTNGYQYDLPRTMWRWRDWVIEAFNRNLPYDRFATEQLAGDLLPDATLEQRIATGFNRNHPFTIEPGVIDEEYRVQYVSDRVTTMGFAFLGLTFDCSKCHDHKFDPITQKDYYSMFSFFNNVPENGFNEGTPVVAPPAIPTPTEEQCARLEAIAAELAKAQAAEVSAALQAEKKAIEAAVVQTMIMVEMPEPRPAFVLERGQYDQPREAVTARTPSSLPPLPEGAPANRLGLAEWMTAPENPLFARVAVNRFWKMLFGAGIVTSLNDFGSQGAAPTHPDLLDWLAVEFRENGWDTKALLRGLALSATYRQASQVTAELLAVDRENQWLARMPRRRLSAEMIRDGALSISGLLVEKLGGPSVYPYQPSGLWEVLTIRPGYQMTYAPSKSGDLYRRGLYTFWKRASPPPSLQSFDAPDREFCVVSRHNTTTPLQALVLLNDPTYVEAARQLGTRMIREGGATPDERFNFAIGLATSRPPTDSERAVLNRVFLSQAERFKADPEAARNLLSAGASPVDPNLDPVELASYTMVASTILNLDETVTRE